MKKIRICIIGGGNISNTRHIPAIQKNSALKITGIISNNHNNIDHIKTKFQIENSLLIAPNGDVVDQLKHCDWFINNVDAAIIGIPPMQHYIMTKACLILHKHVLVEKPMMMNINECDEVIRIAKANRLILNVMHSFQFANGIMQMEKRFQNGEFGNLESILELQLTNRQRRLPKWYNELPLGLFYDEAAHFFYSAIRFGGHLKILNADAQYNTVKENTPKFLQAQMMAGATPVQMFMNFNSPICEWGILLICDKKIAIYDYFKDILIVIDNDNQHYAKDVLKVSSQFFFGFWKGFIKNGFKMVSHKLLYGHDLAIKAFAEAIQTGKEDYKISAELGREVVSAMNDIILKAGEKR